MAHIGFRFSGNRKSSERKTLSIPYEVNIAEQILSHNFRAPKQNGMLLRVKSNGEDFYGVLLHVVVVVVGINDGYISYFRILPPLNDVRRQ